MDLTEFFWGRPNMRVKVGKALRVQIGDRITVIAKLPPQGKLARLFVFARNVVDDQFSPYIPGITAKLELVTDKPQLLTPLMFRLTEDRRQNELTLVADFNGRLQIMQELDMRSDPRVVITWQHRIDPTLPFLRRMSRQLSSWLPT